MSRKDHLIPLPDTDNSLVQAERGRKGGLTKTPKRSVAAKLRWVRETGLTEKGSQRLLDLYEHKEVSSLEILNFIDRWKNDCDSPKDAAAIGRLYVDWSKMVHGSADKAVTNVNVQANIDLSVGEELAKFLERRKSKK